MFICLGKKWCELFGMKTVWVQGLSLTGPGL